MINSKTQFLNSLVTTALLLIIIFGNICVSVAETVIITSNIPALSDNYKINSAPNPFRSGIDSLAFGGDYTVATGDKVNITTLDINGSTHTKGAALIFNHDSSLGSVSDSVRDYYLDPTHATLPFAPEKKIDITVNATLKLTGTSTSWKNAIPDFFTYKFLNTYEGVRTINLATPHSQLTITGNVQDTYLQDILIDNTSGDSNNVILNIMGENNIKINGPIGITKPLKEINITNKGNTTLSGSIKAVNISLMQDSTLAIGGPYPPWRGGPPTQKNSEFTGSIDNKTNYDGIGILNIQNTNISGSIGFTKALKEINIGGENSSFGGTVKAKTINIKSNKVEFNGDILADQIIVNNNSNLTQINIAKDIMITGDLKGSNMRLIIDDKKLVYKGKLELSGKSAIAVLVSEKDCGHIVLTSGSEFNVASGILTLSVTTQPNIDIKNVVDKAYPIFIKETDAVKINIPPNKFGPGGMFYLAGSGDNRLVWSYHYETNSIYATDITFGFLTGVMSKAPHLIDPFMNVEQDSSADNFLNLISRVNTQEAAKIVAKLLPVNTTPNAMSHVIASVQEIICTIPSTVLPTIAKRLTNLANIAAGDETLETKYGVWASPLYGEAIQKAMENNIGYKGKYYGGTAGIDTMLNDKLTLGIAASVIKTSLNHQEDKSGDKTKAIMSMLSIYGLQELSNNWFVQGVGAFGLTKVKNDESRNILNTVQTANGKYTSTSYNMELVGGYNYQQSESCLISPMAGLRYGIIKDGKYKESGTTFQNLSIGKKSTSRLDAILGAKALMTTQINNLLVTPEIHFFVNRKLQGKATKMDARLDGLPGSIASAPLKPTQTYFNSGVSVSFGYNNSVEYGAGYDAVFAKKYLSHQGTLKIRASF